MQVVWDNGGTDRCVGCNALHADFDEALVVVEYALVVVVPEDVGGLLERLRDNTLEAHCRPGLHVQLRFANYLDLWH